SHSVFSGGTMRTWIQSLAVLIILVAGADSALAQNARITGTLKDQSGAVLPGATVTARNQETGLTRTATTDAVGDYVLAALPPGPYKVTVSVQGFAAESRPDLVLVIDQTANLDFSLKPSTFAENVTVQAESPMVDTTASTVATSVSTEQIQNLPVASR